MTLSVDGPWDLPEGAVASPVERIFSAEEVAAFCRLIGDATAVHTLGADVQIVPGAMLLSAVASVLQESIDVRRARHAVLAKIDQARFPASLPVGRKCRFQIRVARTRRRGNGAFVTAAVTCADIVSGREVMSVEVTDFYET